jgi:DNA-binding transcriptional LysR family regulator
VAIAGRPPADPRVVGRPFAPNELVLIAAPDDALVGGRVEPGRLAARTWLLREPGSGTRQLTTEFIAQHGLEPRTLTLGSNAAIVKSVALGLGISIQSREAVASELASGELAEVHVRGGLPERSWHVLNAAGAPIRRPVQLFLDFVLG